jgi:hypothetical protein
MWGLVQSRGLGPKLDDEVVEPEPFVGVDRPGEPVDRAAEALAQVSAGVGRRRISDLHADRASQGGRVPALSLQRRLQLGQPPAEQVVRRPYQAVFQASA